MSDTHNSSAPAKRRGQFAKGDPRINRGGRVSAHRDYLRKLIGERGEKGYDAILEIAEGKTAFEKMVREPRPDEDLASAQLIPVVLVTPSMRERLDAWTFLLEQLNGKSVSQVEVSGQVDHTHTAKPHDLRKLSGSQLDQLEQLVQAARSADADVLDAEIIVEPAALPAAT